MSDRRSTNYRSRRAVFYGNVCIRIIMIGIFVFFSRYWYLGKHRGVFIIGIVTFAFIYNRTAGLYGGFRSGNSRIRDICLAQGLSIFWASSAGFVINCISSHKLQGWSVFLSMLMLQIIIVVVWACKMNQIYMCLHKPREVLLVCRSERKDELIRVIEKNTAKFHLAGYAEPEDALAVLGKRPYKDTVNCLIVSTDKGDSRRQIFAWCLQNEIKLYMIPEAADVQIGSMRMVHVLEKPMVLYQDIERFRAELAVKRVFDIVVGTAAIIILAPVMVGIAVAIKIDDSGPVFFCQDRYTKDEKVFRMIKFRSMYVDKERHGVMPTTQGDSRITRVGSVIRSFRLDELPQLFNIVKGDMSFVGPRPEQIELYEYYAYKTPEFRLRSRMKGGLTGYAQVYGKYNTEPEDKLIMDLAYIENWSLSLDFKLLMKTVQVCLKRESTEGFQNDKAEELINHTEELISKTEEMGTLS